LDTYLSENQKQRLRLRCVRDSIGKPGAANVLCTNAEGECFANVFDDSIDLKDYSKRLIRK